MNNPASEENRSFFEPFAEVLRICGTMCINAPVSEKKRSFFPKRCKFTIIKKEKMEYEIFAFGRSASGKVSGRF